MIRRNVELEARLIDDLLNLTRALARAESATQLRGGRCSQPFAERSGDLSERNREKASCPFDSILPRKEFISGRTRLGVGSRSFGIC